MIKTSHHKRELEKKDLFSSIWDKICEYTKKSWNVTDFTSKLTNLEKSHSKNFKIVNFGIINRPVNRVLSLLLEFIYNTNQNNQNNHE